MAADIVAAQQRFNAQLLAQERAAARAMAEAYATAYRAIQVKFTALLDKIAAAQEAGAPVKVSWLYEEQRLSVLRATVEAEMAKFSRLAQGETTAAQAQAIELAKVHAKAAILNLIDDPAKAREIAAHIDYVTTLPDVVANLVGTLGNGAPLSALFDELGKDASKLARDVLISGVANGLNPRVIARQLRDAMGGNLVRALTVARTETLRSYRAASANIYRANDDVIGKWMWVTALDDRVCVSCAAMHGTLHDLDEDFGSHPNCRCSQAPVAKGSRVQVQTGEDWFAQQPEATQRSMLGNAGFKLYQQGAPLSAFVKETESQAWGISRTVKSATQVAVEMAA